MEEGDGVFVSEGPGGNEGPFERAVVFSLVPDSGPIVRVTRHSLVCVCYI